MLARKPLPQSYRDWNRIHGAPWGHAKWFSRRGTRLIPSALRHYFGGPFSIQTNSSTRLFEYPWAFFATPIAPGLTVLDIGGGLGGFQFTLDRAGCTVVNLDPGMESRGKGWRCDSATIAKLNRIFGTSVELQNTTMDEANFSEEYFDRIFSISVIEHVPEEEREALMMKAYRCLKKGGYFVLTVDLFLDLAPFTERDGNQWGNNANIKALIEAAPFRLISGNTAEMNGFPAFRPEVIKENLENFFQGNYPVLCQCLVLQK